MAKSKEHMGKKSSPGSRSASVVGIGMSSGVAAPKAGSYSHTPKGAKMSDEVRQRAEMDMSVLHRAHQIVTDKPRHAAVKQHAAEVFAAAHAPAVSKSTNARGNTVGFPAARGPGESVSRRGKR